MARLQNLVSNSTLGLKLAMAFGRWMPPSLGIPLAQHMADLVASRRTWTLVRNARLNQWVARGEKCSEEELNDAVRQTLRCQALAIYDMYRCMSYPAEMESKVILPPRMEELIANSHQLIPGKGVLLAGVHLSNFDLAMHTIARRGCHALLITLPELTGAYKQQFEMRRSAGLEISLASPVGFRQAIRRLEAGGLVVTGIDRPILQPKHKPRFFGKPSSLPVHHVHLALKAHVPIVLLGLRLEEDGSYHVLVSNPIPMQPELEHNSEILHNAEAVLAVAEDLIRAKPEQWAQFLPVWQDISAEKALPSFLL